MTARKAVSARRPAPPKRDAALKAPPPFPNRINELAKARGLTHDDIAAALGVNRTTVADRARGAVPMNQDWQHKLAEFFQVPLGDILEKPASEGLRAVPVMLPLAAGDWSESHQYEPDDRDSVMVPDDPRFRTMSLYAGKVVGDSMNRLYPDGTIVVLSRMAQRPGEILEGKRYHIRRTRAGGLVEETIKTLVRDSKGRYWMQPESDSPEFSAVPLDGGEDEVIELVGRVRWSVRPED